MKYHTQSSKCVHCNYNSSSIFYRAISLSDVVVYLRPVFWANLVPRSHDKKHLTRLLTTTLNFFSNWKIMKMIKNERISCFSYTLYSTSNIPSPPPRRYIWTGCTRIPLPLSHSFISLFTEMKKKSNTLERETPSVIIYLLLLRTTITIATVAPITQTTPKEVATPTIIIETP